MSSRQRYGLHRPRRVGCHYCDRKASTWDHIVPRSRGGRNAKWNLVPSCKPCNQAKGDRMPTCWCWRCRRALRRWEDANRTAADVAEMTGDVA